jgi:MFS family permease
MLASTALLSRTVGALHDSSFRLLWSATVLSFVARAMEATLLAWFVLDLTDSPFQVALVGVFGWTPLILLGLVGGALADSVDRRRLFAATLTVNLIAVLLMTLVLAADLVRVWHAYAVIFVTGSGFALGMAARRSLIHDIVGRDRLTNAVAIDTLGGNASIMLGPAIAGVLISAGSVTVGYVAVSTSFAMSLLLLWRLQPPGGGARRGIGEARMFGTLVSGLRYVGGHTTLLATVLVAVVMNLTITPYIQMVPVIARDVLHVEPDRMGLLISGHGFGAFVGAFVVASAASIRYHGRVYITGSMVALFAVLMFSLSGSYWLSLVIVMGAGLGNAGFNTMQMSLTMLLPREDMRGAALGAMSLGIGAGPTGMLITGWMARTIGTPNALTANAVAGMAALALIALLVPSLRRKTVP